MRYDNDRFDVRLPGYRNSSGKGMRGRTVILVVALGLLLAAGGVAGLVGLAVLILHEREHVEVSSAPARHTQVWTSSSMMNSAAPVLKSLQEDQQEVIDAFRNLPQDDPAPQAANIQVFFDRLAASLREGKLTAFSDAFDADYMVEELLPPKLVNFASAVDRRAFAAGIKEGFRKGVTNVRDSDPWIEFKVKKIRPLRTDASELLVYLRARAQRGTVDRQRWWLRKDGNSWRWYDIEHLEFCDRISVVVAWSLDGNRGWSKNAPQYLALVGAARRHQWDEVMQLSSDLEKVPLPPSYRNTALIWKGAAQMNLWKLDEAAIILEALERRGPAIPKTQFFLAQVHNRLGQYDKAIEHACKYVALLGDNAEVYHEMGKANLGLKRPADAVIAFRNGLDEDPDHVANMIGLCRSILADVPERLSAERKKDLVQRMGRLSSPQEQIVQILPTFLYGKDNTELFETLLKAYLARVPNSFEGDYYSIRLKIMKADIEAACRLFRELVAQVKDQRKRDSYVYGFLEGMVDAGKAVEGYQAAPDASQGFRFVADALIENEHADQAAQLRALVDVHRQNAPNDPMLLYYSGEAHLLKQEYPEAEADFARGLAQRNLTEEEKLSYSGQYTAAAFENGNGLKAYATAEDKKAAFVQLRWLFDNKKDAAGLAQLVEAHRKNDAEDVDLSLWDAEVKWLQRDYEAVVRILNQNRNTILIERANRWQFRDRLVRSLGYLKRVDEALTELHRDNEPNNGILEAVVFAVAGDVNRTEEALARYTKQGYTALSFHGDADLGPALRSEPFKKLCEKYPDSRKKMD